MDVIPEPFSLGYQQQGTIGETGVIMHEEMIVRENYIHEEAEQMKANQPQIIKVRARE